MEKNLWALNVVDMRDFALDKHRSVDDRPYGGGAGMVLLPDVVHRAVESVVNEGTQGIYYLSPRGSVLTQKKSEAMSKSLLSEKAHDVSTNLVFVCGRFEGIDERVLEHWAMEEISIGDYILCGGDVAVMALLESVIRLLPGVLGSEDSLSLESFALSLLENPHYTRPETWNGKVVPEVLRSGDHAKINQWRLRQAETITQERRPDLWQRYIEK